MDIYTLLKIFFVAGNYLRGVHCDTNNTNTNPSIDMYKNVIKAFYSGSGPPSTILSAENIAMMNTRCFVALLNHIKLNITKPEDAQPEKLGVYKHYLLTNIQMLNTDIFTTYREDIIKLYRDMNKDAIFDASGKTEPVIASEIQKRTSELVKTGVDQNMWYLDTGYITERKSNKYDVEFTEEHTFYNNCSEMYNSLKPSNSELNELIRKSILSYDNEKRLNLYMSMPIVIKDHLKQFIQTNNSDSIVKDNKVYLKEIINSIIKFYEENIVNWFKEAEILLIRAYYSNNSNARKNKWFFDVDYFMTNLTIVDNIVEKISIIVLKFKYLLGFDLNIRADFEKDFDEKYTAQLKHFNTTKNLIMNGEEISDESSYKIENLTRYPDLLFYYPNYHLLKSSEFNENTILVLNLQAWIIAIALKLDTTIIACELLGITRPILKKISDQKLESGDGKTAQDKGLDRSQSGSDISGTQNSNSLKA